MLLDLEDVLISYPTSSINNDHTLVDLDRQSHIMSSGMVSSETDLVLCAAVLSTSYTCGINLSVLF